MVHIGRPVLRATAVGLFLGIANSATTLRTMRSLLFGLDVYGCAHDRSGGGDPVAILAVTLPALREATIDPAMTLRRVESRGDGCAC